jgi:hypothetical protein
MNEKKTSKYYCKMEKENLEHMEFYDWKIHFLDRDKGERKILRIFIFYDAMVQWETFLNLYICCVVSRRILSKINLWS